MNCRMRGLYNGRSNSRCVRAALSIGRQHGKIHRHLTIDAIHSSRAKGICVGVIGLLGRPIGAGLSLADLGRYFNSNQRDISTALRRLANGCSSEGTHPARGAMGIAPGFRCRLPTCSFALVTLWREEGPPRVGLTGRGYSFTEFFYF